jgi:hypothetical protein
MASKAAPAAAVFGVRHGLKFLSGDTLGDYGHRPGHQWSHRPLLLHKNLTRYNPGMTTSSHGKIYATAVIA